MAALPLAVHDVCGVTCVGVEGRPRGIAFAFVGRTGGVSTGAFASLNVGDAVGDSAAAVEENRRRALAAIGVSEAAVVARTVVPRQVHGSDVVCVSASDAAALASARAAASAGADAVVVCTQAVPALMCFADCVPLVLIAPHAFALVHAGWRGSLSRLPERVAHVLAHKARCSVADLWAYIGPHVGAASYEVSDELAHTFAAEFGRAVLVKESSLDLGAVVAGSLIEAGVSADNVVDCGIDTARAVDAWYSHRSGGGHTGRHAAVAWIPGS